MNVFIINLERVTQRRDHMLEQIAPYGKDLDFHFFPGIDARRGEHLSFSRYFSNFWVYFYKGRALSATEQGCFASHFSVWQKCAELNEPVVVLEDDIILKENFLPDLQKIMSSPHQYVRLWCLFFSHLFPLKGDYALSFGKPSGAQGYYLTPAAARRFIAHAGIWFCPVDDYMDLFFYHGVPNILYRNFLLDDPSAPSCQEIRPKRPFLMVQLAEFCKIFRLIYRSIYLFFNKKRLLQM